MGNTANLKPWKTGVSGNPQGRPKGTPNWSTTVRQLLSDGELLTKLKEHFPEYIKDSPCKNLAEHIAVTMMLKAVEGDVAAAEWLRSTGYGESYKHSKNNENTFEHVPLKITYVKESLAFQTDKYNITT